MSKTIDDRAANMIEAASTWRKERKVDSFELGEAMRDFRLDCNKSLRSIAAMMGISAPYLSDCERGFRKLDEVKLKRFIECCEAQDSR